MGSQDETITLRVEGMDCANEVALIEKKMKGLEGIASWRPDLMTQQLTVIFAPAAVKREAIIKAIEQTGMKASVVLDRASQQSVPWWKQAQMVCLAACGLLFAVAFVLEKVPGTGVMPKILYAAAVAVGAYYPARMGVRALLTGVLNIRLLMVCGAAGAIALGHWEEAAMLVFIYSLGDVLEAYAVGKARRSIRALMELVPKEALLRRDGQEILAPVESVHLGDTIIVRPGEKVPLDGVVSAGGSTVDQSSITGESLPAAKGVGDQVFAGTINQRGALDVRVTHLAEDTTLARIIHSVEEAQARKSSYQRFGERFGKYYTPAMFLLAILVTVVPPVFLGQPFSPWFYRGLVLLVVSCSCGLALSVPVAVVAAVANAARHGVLYKGGASLEAAGKVRVLAFDKTGTLTLGQPVVTDLLPADSADGREVLSIAAAVESRSEHPLAEAVLRRAREENLPIRPVTDFEAMPGSGARAKIDGVSYTVGNLRLFEHLLAGGSPTAERVAALESEGKTTILVGTDGRILGIIAVADQMRSETPAAVKSLKAIGLGPIVMLTGDGERTAKAVAGLSGVDECRSGLLPEGKVQAVRELRSRFGHVAMVGDGVNDAPAMAEADVGIAMGAAGTDVAIETADIALMSDDLRRLPYALALSRRAVNNIKQNIVASLAIVAILVPTALVGWIGLVPGLLLNEISALIVILNALRLLNHKGG